MMGRASFTEGHLIDARLSSTESLLHSNRDCLFPNLAIYKLPYSCNVSAGDRTYSSMIKLIAGSMEGYTHYHDIYSGIENTETNSDSNKETSPLSIPTLVDTARKVAQYEGTHMDEKQYVTYEVICCTFILGLVNETNNPNSSLSTFLKQAI